MQGQLGSLKPKAPRYSGVLTFKTRHRVSPVPISSAQLSSSDGAWQLRALAAGRLGTASIIHLTHLPSSTLLVTRGS